MRDSLRCAVFPQPAACPLGSFLSGWSEKRFGEPQPRWLWVAMRSSLLSVMVCASCGHENSDAARFCEACAAALGGGSGERRKVVSVLFCDVVGSTALGELLDPEALRALLARYFDRMRGPLRITAVRWRSSSAMR
jgi:hypothetical protein